MKKIFLNPRLLLPLIVLLGALVVTMRVADMLDTITSGKLVVHTAQAKSEEPPKGSHEGPPSPSAAPQAEVKTEQPSFDAEEETSPAEMDVLKQLSERREQLEKRSRDLDTREALLKITEQRVAQKIQEMEVLRQQVQALVNQAAGAQQAQLDNLVKIYETMKPDEAAKIFETMDMPILLGVIQRMKPARTALVMAMMPPEKAKEITVALTKQDQLPQVK